MDKRDYIVVGSGIAGIAFCEQLRLHNKSFVVFDNNSQQSSRVAAGLYNPVVLKRFTKVWKAKEQLEMAMPKYQWLEELLQCKLDHRIPVFRRFTSVEEQNDWFAASDRPVLSEFLSTQLKKNLNPNVNAEYGFGEVLHSGRINTTLLTRKYQSYLESQGLLRSEVFDHSALEITTDRLIYKDVEARNAVFAEGFGIKSNPFFNDLPLNGTKGEMLTIKAPDLKLDFILKSSVFVVPLGDDNYWIGATYEREDKTHDITDVAKTELLDKLKQVITCDFEVIDQVAGIRPTTKDRRPLVGAHETHKNIFVLNGLGTRGVMMSHFVADQLFKHIEDQQPLMPDIDIARFTK